MAVPLREQRILFQKSGNRCAYSGCRRLLTAEASPADSLVVLGAAAHVVAERNDGPRGISQLTPAERNKYENLILLCSQHHQLIDGQPATYTVERLHAMKQAHEQWVEKTLGLGVDDRKPTALARVRERVYSNLLPLEYIPQYVYGAACTQPSDSDVRQQLRPLRNGEMASFILRNDKLFTFHKLDDPDNPFRDIVADDSIERYRLYEWLVEPDKTRWFVELANRSLNTLARRRGLVLDRSHDRHYFPAVKTGEERSVRYRALNTKRASRRVVWSPKSKRTGESRGYWYHRAVSLRFVHITTTKWCLSLRPELRVTVDGTRPLDPRLVGGKVTRKMSRMFNYDLLGEVQFWRDYLSESKPRIILPFGSPRQNIIIATALMEGDISWPGIPPEHAKPFTNVYFLDDLFSWAELHEIEPDEQDDELNDDPSELGETDLDETEA